MALKLVSQPSSFPTAKSQGALVVVLDAVQCVGPPAQAHTTTSTASIIHNLTLNRTKLATVGEVVPPDTQPSGECTWHNETQANSYAMKPPGFVCMLQQAPRLMSGNHLLVALMLEGGNNGNRENHIMGHTLKITKNAKLQFLFLCN